MWIQDIRRRSECCLTTGLRLLLGSKSVKWEAVKAGPATAKVIIVHHHPSQVSWPEQQAASWGTTYCLSSSNCTEVAQSSTNRWTIHRITTTAVLTTTYWMSPQLATHLSDDGRDGVETWWLSIVCSYLHRGSMWRYPGHQHKLTHIHTLPIHNTTKNPCSLTIWMSAPVEVAVLQLVLLTLSLHIGLSSSWYYLPED